MVCFGKKITKDNLGEGVTKLNWAKKTCYGLLSLTAFSSRGFEPCNGVGHQRLNMECCMTWKDFRWLLSNTWTFRVIFGFPFNYPNYPKLLGIIYRKPHNILAHILAIEDVWFFHGFIDRPSMILQLASSRMLVPQSGVHPHTFLFFRHMAWHERWNHLSQTDLCDADVSAVAMV